MAFTSLHFTPHTTPLHSTSPPPHRQCATPAHPILNWSTQWLTDGMSVLCASIADAVECGESTSLLEDSISPSDPPKTESSSPSSSSPHSALTDLLLSCPSFFPFSVSSEWSSALWQLRRVVSVLLNLCALMATICWLVMCRWSAPLSSFTGPITDTVNGRANIVHTGRSVDATPAQPYWSPPTSLSSTATPDSSLLLSLNGTTGSADLVFNLFSHLCIDELPGRWGNHVYIIMMAVMYAQRHHLILHLPPFNAQPLLAHADLFTSPCPTDLLNVTVQQQGDWWLTDPQKFVAQQEGGNTTEQQQPASPIAVHLQGFFQVSTILNSPTPLPCLPSDCRSRHDNRTWVGSMMSH